VTSAAIRTRIGLGAAAGLAVALIALAPVAGSTPKFFDDDPITRVPESQDASGAAEWDIDLFYDLMYNTFATPRTIKTGWRAQNLNTIEEVPDSGWFTNRILARPLSAEQLLQGANTSADGGLDVRKGGKLTIIKPKDVGAAPGAVVRGPSGETWFISFDPPDYPEAATGSIMVASRLFWALGYWQAEQYLATVREEDFVIAPDAVIRPPSGNKRPMKREDLQAVLRRVYRYGDGSYRIAASKLLPGKVLGGFRYHGTRPDDPNDIVPHEHRRELRALKVFGAWTNLTDMKAGNTIDTLVTDERGRKTVRHWLQDVGSTFGIGANGRHDWWEGWETLYAGDVAWKRIYSLGFHLSPWQTAGYQKHDSIGIFEGEEFDPETWHPRSLPGAFLAARDDDNFWAARRVVAFTDEMIRTVVKAARFSDPGAEKILADVLIARRDKIARAYLPKLNPIVDVALDPSGVLTFANAAVDARVAEPPTGGYRAEWALFDNATGQTRPLGPETSTTLTRVSAPSGLPTADGTYIRVALSAVTPAIGSWARPVHAYFKRTAGSWKLVGFERLPEQEARDGTS
jgi:hypothetical protein